MNQEVKYDMMLKLLAGNVKPNPPISTVIGPTGINLKKFCEDFNNWSKDMNGVIEVGIIINNDLSYQFLSKKQYLIYKRNELNNIIALSPLYKQFKDYEDAIYQR